MKTDYNSEFFNKTRKIVYDYVFILPPWREIYVNDKARYETYDQSIKIYEEILAIYKLLNVNLIELEKNSVNRRIDIIINTIK